MHAKSTQSTCPGAPRGLDSRLNGSSRVVSTRANVLHSRREIAQSTLVVTFHHIGCFAGRKVGVFAMPNRVGLEP